MQQRWITFRQQLQELHKLKIPRWLGIIRSTLRIEIHEFSDVSNLAMAAVVYVRVFTDNETLIVRLISSKIRVAPLKHLTIPRLELTAAMLLTKLIKHVITAIDVNNVPIFLWTDSIVTLTWISTNPARWKDFIRNRVTTIQETIPSAVWRFIPGKQNSADCASRGMTVEQLVNHSLWWNGPTWLSEPSSSWSPVVNKTSPDAQKEERAGQVMSVVTKSAYWDLLDKYSSLQKLLRVTAWCRFISCLRKMPQTTSNFPLTPSEIEESRLFWI